MMENLSKQFEAWVTNWKRDYFSKARLELMALYCGTTIVLLSAFSYVIFQLLFNQLRNSLGEDILDPRLQLIIFDQARTILLNRIIVADAIVLAVTLVVGYVLTSNTLHSIRDSLKRERRFLAHASHELRTPLTVLKTSVEVALRDERMTIESSRSVLHSVLEEVNGLSALANNLLEISKQKESNHNFKMVSLSRILPKVVKRLEPLANQKKIGLLNIVELTNLKIPGDEIMLEQMFYNIIHNAIMYTPEHGVVRISARSLEQSVIFRIEDTGIGISKDTTRRLFEPFARGDYAHKMTVGSGLGLAIVKSIIDAHMGTISIESEEKKGTIVTVELPKALN